MNNQQYRRSSRSYTYRRSVQKRRRRIVVSASVIVVIAVGGAILFSQLFHSQATEPSNNSSSVSSTQSVSQASSEESSPSSKADLVIDTSFAQWNQTCDWSIVMVNAYNPIPENWEDHIVYPPGFSPCGMDERIQQSVQDLINAAYADGVPIWISSGYRSKEKQKSLLEQEIEGHLRNGLSREQAEIEAKKLVMPAGYSEHQTGLVIDINGVDPNFYQTKAYEWMTQHAAEYGFIERYPEGKDHITGINFEPWHYRYVGVENARAIQQSGLCLEEYIYSKMHS